jgi:hypothetical protein
MTSNIFSFLLRSIKIFDPQFVPKKKIAEFENSEEEEEKKKKKIYIYIYKEWQHSTMIWKMKM